jgi:hypothetical protein
MTCLGVPCAGHCKTLAPTWAELGETMKENPTIKIAHVDCTQHKQVCTDAQVRTAVCGQVLMCVVHMHQGRMPVSRCHHCAAFSLEARQYD